MKPFYKFDEETFILHPQCKVLTVKSELKLLVSL